MPLRAHLRELYRRGMISASAILIVAIVGWIAADHIWSALANPIAGASVSNAHHLNFTTVAAAFDLRIQLALTFGVVVTSPLWLYQVMAFVAPALARRELVYTLAYTVSAAMLFLIGAATGALIIPHMVELLLSFVPSSGSALLDARAYMEFVFKLMIATGIAFVLPVVLVLLNSVGAVSGVAMLKSWRWAIVGVFTFTALATPSADVLAMFLLAAPMVGLYFGAVLIATLSDRRRLRRNTALVDA
jgi:sec-independent protein translocase protein TatC